MFFSPSQNLNSIAASPSCSPVRFGLVLFLVSLLVTGCVPESASESKVDAVIGSRGIGKGHFQKPRAIAIDKSDRIFVCDMTGRIQVLNSAGESIALWKTPLIEQGKPTGLSIDIDGNLMVADTHYFRILFYTPEGKWLEEKTIGGTGGIQPGEFGLVTDIAIDRDGNYFIAEYGENDRIQKISRDGKFLMQFGGHGTELGKFQRPQSIAFDKQGQLWVADACNHRIQIFDVSGPEAKLVRAWGVEGTKSGEFRYPYGVYLSNDDFVYVTEFGNNRVQKFTLAGEFIESWGSNGSLPGQLYQPWSMAQDSQGRCYVLDSYNHRLQRFRL